MQLSLTYLSMGLLLTILSFLSLMFLVEFVVEFKTYVLFNICVCYLLWTATFLNTDYDMVLLSIVFVDGIFIVCLLVGIPNVSMSGIVSYYLCKFFLYSAAKSYWFMAYLSVCEPTIYWFEFICLFLVLKSL